MEAGFGRSLIAAALAVGVGCQARPVQPEASQPVRPQWERVIVQLRLPPHDSEEERLAAIVRTRDQLLHDLGTTPHRVTRLYTTIAAIALEVSPEALRVIEKSAHVAGVEKDSLSAPQ